MSYSTVSSFYRRGSSVTGSLIASDHDLDSVESSGFDPRSAAAAMSMEHMTPPITPRRAEDTPIIVIPTKLSALIRKWIEY